MVVTDGDHFAELIRAEKLGIVVEAGNVSQLADALETVLFDAEFAAEAKRNIARVRERYYWGAALAPLIDFVAHPHHAGDNADISLSARARARKKRKKRSGLRRDAELALFYLRSNGPRVVVSKVLRRLRRS
jgi:hypothetical protein